MQTKYLDNSPLYSAIIEIRFTASIPEDAIPGVLYSKLIDPKDPQIQISSLPASQLPLALRQQDPNLKYAPVQRIILPDMMINVGSNVISLEANNARQAKSYPGWEEFFKQFQTIVEKMNFIVQIERIGLRYVNIFNEKDFLGKLNVNFSTGWEGKGLSDNNTLIFFVDRNDLKTKVMIATDVSIQDENGLTQGQLIDIDTFIEGDISSEDLNARVAEAHAFTKEIFYSLPGAELLAKMGPHKK